LILKSGDYVSEIDLIGRSLKAECFLQLMAEREFREISSLRRG
jgi:hypothetical protein